MWVSVHLLIVFPFVCSAFLFVCLFVYSSMWPYSSKLQLRATLAKLLHYCNGTTNKSSVFPGTASSLSFVKLNHQCVLL